MRWLNGITDAKDMNLGRLRVMVRGREAWRAAIHDMTEQLNHNVNESRVYSCV